MFVLSIFLSLFCWFVYWKFYFFALYKYLLTSQKRKVKQKKKLLQKASQNCLSIKAIFERNEPSTSSHTDRHSPDLENDSQISPEIIQLERTSNYDHHDNVRNENNRERIKSSKYRNVSFNGIPGKSQPKYIDFPKILSAKSSRSFISKCYN